MQSFIPNRENKNPQSIYLSTNASSELKITVARKFELQIISLRNGLEEKRRGSNTKIP